jgi:hypothetical protein
MREREREKREEELNNAESDNKGFHSPPTLLMSNPYNVLQSECQSAIFLSVSNFLHHQHSQTWTDESGEREEPR